MTMCRRRDLRHRHQRANVEHLGTGQHEYRTRRLRPTYASHCLLGGTRIGPPKQPQQAPKSGGLPAPTPLGNDAGCRAPVSAASQHRNQNDRSSDTARRTREVLAQSFKPVAVADDVCKYRTVGVTGTTGRWSCRRPRARRPRSRSTYASLSSRGHRSPGCRRGRRR